MNQLPINKILIASFAFAMIHWKKILEISIIPVSLSLPLFSILPELFASMKQVFSTQESTLTGLIAPDNMMLYLALFLYANVSLSISIYRLVVLGGQSVSVSPILELKTIIRFIGMTLLVGVVTMVPLALTNLLILQFFMSFLVVPITLNFVSIAIGEPSKYRWGLSFYTHMNLFFLQVIVPLLVVLLLTSLSKFLSLDMGMEWIARILMFYWNAITLALCYKLIRKLS